MKRDVVLRAHWQVNSRVGGTRVLSERSDARDLQPRKGVRGGAERSDKELALGVAELELGVPRRAMQQRDAASRNEAMRRALVAGCRAPRERSDAEEVCML